MEACPACVEARTALAEEFRRLRPLFVALGDENRQRVFLALLEADQVGLRALSGHICAVTESAAAEGYPYTEEES